jgi:hypothetical protein
MPRYRPPDHLPAELLNRTDLSEACTDRDLGAVFGIAIKYGVGFTPSHLARRCEMTVSKVQDYVNGRTLAQSIIVFERVADGLHIPGHMFGMARRPWEDPETSFPPGDQAAAQAMVAAYSGRGSVSRGQWNEIIEGAGKRIWLYGMAEFGYATDDDVPGMLTSATARGCEVRVLLLNPDYAGTVTIDADEGSPPGTLSTRIRAALAHFLRCRKRVAAEWRSECMSHIPL